jgi:hypothetical protein
MKTLSMVKDKKKKERRSLVNAGEVALAVLVAIEEASNNLEQLPTVARIGDEAVPTKIERPPMNLCGHAGEAYWRGARALRR